MDSIFPALLLVPLLAVPWVLSLTYYRLVKPEGVWRWIEILFSAGLFIASGVGFVVSLSPWMVVYGCLLAPLWLLSGAIRSFVPYEA